jgi:hypothetical protein
MHERVEWGEMALTIEQCECIPADSAPVLVVSGAIALGTTRSMAF